MPIITEWDDDAKTVIRERYSDPWTWEDFAQAGQLILAMLDEVDHPVALINVFGSVALPKSTLGHLPEISSNAVTRHRNLGRVIIVSSSKLVQVMGDIFASLSRSDAARIRFVQTEEEASRLLAETP